MSHLANFTYEVGMLNHIPRSSLAFLGSGRQSVSEHAFRELHIARLLVRLSNDPIDVLRVLDLVMFHSLPEARTGDSNDVYQRYDRSDEEKLYADLAKELPFGDDIVRLIREFKECSTAEAQVANDADRLELIATLKEQQDLGIRRAADEILIVLTQLKTEGGRQLAEELVRTPSDDWWFQNKHDQHWVDRGRSEGE